MIRTGFLEITYLSGENKGLCVKYPIHDVCTLVLGNMEGVDIFLDNPSDSKLLPNHAALTIDPRGEHVTLSLSKSHPDAYLSAQGYSVQGVIRIWSGIVLYLGSSTAIKVDFCSANDTSLSLTQKIRNRVSDQLYFASALFHRYLRVHPKFSTKGAITMMVIIALVAAIGTSAHFFDLRFGQNSAAIIPQTALRKVAAPIKISDAERLAGAVDEYVKVHEIKDE